MQNESSTIIFLMALLCSAHTFAGQPNRCESAKIDSLDRSNSNVICDKKLGVLYLKHDQRKRLIWLESQNRKFYYPLIKFKPNADPSMVGEEKSIAFITPNVVDADGRKFVGLTIAERSSRGDGTGYCGAGSEIYFISIEISQTKIIEHNRFLVSSCKEDIYLDDDGGTKNYSMTFSDDQRIIFKWLNYPKHENPVTGSYDFLTNNLSVIEDKKPRKGN